MHPLSWGFCPRRGDLAVVGSGVLSKGLIPPRSGTCSSQAACLLAVGSVTAHRLSPAATELRVDFEAFFLAEIARLAPV
jgi:hypothetical protein